MGYNGIDAFLQDTYYRSNQCVYQFLDQSVHTLMNLENIVFYLTSRDITTVRRTSWGFDISIRNSLKPTRSLYDFRFKSYGSNCGFHDFGDLNLDICHMH